MLRTNLSTRPFYNIRAVQVTLGAMALLVIVLTLLNAGATDPADQQRTRPRRAGGAGRGRCPRLRDEARRIRSQIDAKELNEVAAAARRGQLDHRPARVLVVGAVLAARDDDARERATDQFSDRGRSNG